MIDKEKTAVAELAFELKNHSVRDRSWRQRS